MKEIAKELGGIIKEEQIDENQKKHCQLRRTSKNYDTWGVHIMKQQKIEFSKMPSEWDLFNKKPDTQEIMELCRKPVPERIEINGRIHEPSKAAVENRSSLGILNTPDLIADGLIKLTDSFVTQRFLPCKLFDTNGVFIGQHEDGQPNGFIIFISDDRIFEGNATAEVVNGWGRFISMNRCEIGWWN